MADEALNPEGTVLSGYDQLSTRDILLRLPELNYEELIEVQRREEAGARRVLVLRTIGNLLESAAGTNLRSRPVQERSTKRAPISSHSHGRPAPGRGHAGGGERRPASSAANAIPKPPAAATPRSGAALSEKGREAFDAGRYATALEMYQRLLGVDDSNDDARKAVAACYFKLDQYGEVAAVCREILQRDPGSAETARLLADSERQLARVDVGTRSPPVSDRTADARQPSPAPIVELPSGSWRRGLAFAIDTLLVGVGSAVVTAPLPLPDPNAGVEFNWGVFWLATLLDFVIGTASFVVYSGLMDGSERGQTVGRMAFGICLRDADTGGPVGFQRAALRRLILELLNITVIAGIINFIVLLRDDRRQAWHDKVAATVVVRIP